MPRKKELNESMRAESITKIIEASTRLFAAKGFSQCKMTDIAGAAGMSVGNLYWYYNSKKDVLKAVLQAGFKQQETLLSGTISMDAPVEEKLDILIDRYLIMCKEHVDFFSVILNLLGSGGVSYFHELGFDTTAIGKGYHTLLIKLLGESAPGSFSEEELNNLPVFFFAFFCGLMLVYGADWHSIPPDQIKAAVKRLLKWKVG